MSNVVAKDIREAKLWCEQARKILKLKRFGPSERQSFKDALDKVEVLLPKLSEAKVYGEILRQYMDIATEAHNAELRKNTKDVVAASQKLAQLAVTCEQLLKDHVKWKETSKKVGDRLERKLLEVQKGYQLRDAYIIGSVVNQPLVQAQTLCDQASNYLKQSSEAENLNQLTEANRFLDGVTPKIEEAKKAVELAKGHSNEFLEAMNKYNSLMLSAKQALKDVQGFPGAEKQIALLETLIKTCAKIPKQDKSGLWTGHAEACQKLEKYPVLVRNIQLTSKEHLSKDVSPELTKKYQELSIGDLLELNKIAPPELFRMYMDKARDAVRLGRENLEQAIKDLQGVEQSLKHEVLSQSNSSKEAAKLDKEFDGYIEALEKAGVPLLMYAEPQRIGKAAKENELANRQWTAACQRLSTANKTLSTIAESYQNHGVNWQINRQKLEEYQKSAALWIKVPSLTVLAYKLLAPVLELQAQFKQFAFEANNKAFDETKVDNLNLAQLYTQLKDLAEKANVDSKVTMEKMVAFVGDLNLAQTLVADAKDAAERRLKTGVTKLPVSDAQDLELLHKFYADEVIGVWDEWGAFRSKVKFGDKVIDEAKRLVSKLEKMTVDKQKVADIPSLRKADAPRRAEKLRADIESALEECVLLGRDVDYLCEQLKQIPNSEFEELQKIEKVVLEKRNNARLSQSLLISHQQGEVKKLISKNVVNKLPTGKGFKRDVELHGRDIDALLSETDPYALELAQKKTRELEKRIKDVQENPNVYSQNKDRLGKLSKRISEMQEKMPETHSRLKKKLEEIIGQSKSTLPSDMIGVIDELGASILIGEQELVKRKQQLEEFDKAYEKLENDFKQLKKDTKTWITDKTTSFNVYFETRMSEAKDMKSKEAPVQPAIEALQKLSLELDKIKNSPSPSVALQQRDSEEANNQRIVRDMARQFLVELDVFRNQTYPKAKEVVRDAPNGDGDVDTVKSLKSVADTAEKVVTPYLQLVKVGPRTGKMEAPRMDTLKSDFQRARSMLDEARRSLERLMVSPTSTNVSIDDNRIRGIGKIRAKWQNATRHYSQTLKSIALAIAAKAKGESDEETKTKGQEAAKTIDGLASHFQAGAFESEFRVLEQSLPDDKAERAQVKKQLLASREKVLRTMRQYRTDLIKHPILVKLTDRKTNPFLATEAMSAAASIRAALIEIERQSLISVEN